MTVSATAWDLIGFDGNTMTIAHLDLGLGLPDDAPASVRIRGGRTLYWSVNYDDSRGGRNVRLSRLDQTGGGLRQVDRYVDPDTVLDIVLDDAA